MNLKDITILTVSFNNNLLTGMMLKSFHKQVGELPEVVIVDNGNKIPVDDSLKSCFNVIDNFKNKLLSDEHQPSRNHCKTIDYALKNLIKTKWCLLVDNDILFKKSLKNFLLNFDDTNFDVAGEIGFDVIPPNRLFPYFCLINIDKFKANNLSYYDPARIVSFGIPGHNSKKDGVYDTGASFLEDIKKWKLYNFQLKDICLHLKGATLRNKNYKEWLSANKNLFE